MAEEQEAQEEEEEEETQHTFLATVRVWLANSNIRAKIRAIDSSAPSVSASAWHTVTETHIALWPLDDGPQWSLGSTQHLTLPARILPFVSIIQQIRNIK